MFSENDALAFVQIMPRKNYATLEIIREPLTAIRTALDRLRVREEFRGVRFGLTGRPVLQADEMETTQRDMTLSTSLAFAGVLLLFIFCFRRLRRPLLAGVTLLVALALTFGWVTLTVGYLTLLSVVFAAMLIGLGIDFGIHFLARYQDELEAGRAAQGARAEGEAVDRAVVRTLTTTGVGVFTGGVTTAIAFFTAVFVDFQGLRELGFVAGAGVLLCLLAMVTLLPALVGWTDRRLREPADAWRHHDRCASRFCSRSCCDPSRCWWSSGC